MRVSLEDNNIDFLIEGVSVHRQAVPHRLQHDEILPYVVLLGKGNRIEFTNLIYPAR